VSRLIGNAARLRARSCCNRHPLATSSAAPAHHPATCSARERSARPPTAHSTLSAMATKNAGAMKAMWTKSGK
jgi:hypothetical protein